MQERRYLLNIEQMLEGSGRDILLREAFDRIDGTRRQKVLSVKNARSRAAGIGAGLLIQKALADDRIECQGVSRADDATECQAVSGMDDAMECQVVSGMDDAMECQAVSGMDDATEYQAVSGPECLKGLQTGWRSGYSTASWAEGNSGYSGQPEYFRNSGAAKIPVLEYFSVEELLLLLKRKTVEPCYRYGKNGKPYLADEPFQFNLSHSGDYVFCGVSKREIGVDIQKMQGDNMLRLARRFFAAPECRMLEACGDEELCRQMFFRMWVRKEAYGKLTGEGIAGAVGKCLWRDNPVGEGSSGDNLGKGLWWERELVWEEYDVPHGYRMAVCGFRRETAPEQIFLGQQPLETDFGKFM